MDTYLSYLTQVLAVNQISYLTLVSHHMLGVTFFAFQCLGWWVYFRRYGEFGLTRLVPNFSVAGSNLASMEPRGHGILHIPCPLSPSPRLSLSPGALTWQPTNPTS